MFPKSVTSIRTLLNTFPTEQSCIEHLEKIRWKGNVVSPFVPSAPAWKCKDGNRYICSKTRKYFTVRTCSIYEKTKVPLRDWFVAIWLMNNHKRGISSIQLSKEIGVTVKTAWFMASKIRRSFKIPDEEMAGTTTQQVFEADECVFGGLQANRHKDKKIPNSQGGHGIDKTWVLGIVERGGLLRTFMLAARKPEYVQSIVRSVVPEGSIFITDSWRGYNGLDDKYIHFKVKNGEKSLEGRPREINTNCIEGLWANMKRGYIGTYNWWSKKHLKTYLNEFTFRYNTRKWKEDRRFFVFLQNVFERITQRDIIDKAWT